jgi:hypothetical protein
MIRLLHSQAMGLVLTLVLVCCAAGLAAADTVIEDAAVSDLPDAFQTLLDSELADAFVVVTIEGTEDFLQFYPHRGSVVLDFPVVTARQRGLEARFLGATEQLGLATTALEGENDARFHVVRIGESPERAAAICTELLLQLFDAKATTPLEITRNV